jgi:hypothetical protein
LAWVALLAGLAIGSTASATNTYPNYLGTNYNFTGIQETSNWGDPELPPAGPPTGTCCFGSPTGTGDTLLFFPTDFAATATGAGGSDQTGALLQLAITSVSLAQKIETIYLSEFGDAALTGPASSGTGVFATMSGFVTVLEVNGAAIAPVNIPFNAGGVNPGVTGGFTPATLGTTGLDRNTNPGTTTWNGILTIDVKSLVPNATKVQLSLDNDLYAYTEFAGNSAKIQKKVTDAPSVIIGVVPEPGTFALLGGGLLALAIRARNRRA